MEVTRLMRRLITVMLMGALPLVACGTTKGVDVHIDEDDSGSTIGLNVGDRFDVTLPGNPTTGYSWERVPGTPELLKQVGEPAFVPESEALGAGGRVTLTFEAVASGSGPLALIYHRPFEQETPPLNTFEVKVEVR
jgi:inhibitor of cysteine peptidase